MGLSLVTPTTADAITLAEARDACKVTHPLQDVEIANLIFAAREWSQWFSGRVFMAQTWDYFLHYFPSVIELPLAPVQSITSVKYFDYAGIEQTLSGAAYESDLRSVVQRIRPAAGYSWPGTADRYNAVTVRFVAGYASDHPDLLTIRQAMLLHIRAHFDPEDSERNMKQAEALLWPLKIPGF